MAVPTMWTWCRLRVLLQINVQNGNIRRYKTVGSNSELITKMTIKDSSYKKKARQFVDLRRLRVKAGDGGNGNVSFLSLYANEFAGPDGGDGGNGGHVIFQADTNTKSLTHVQSLYSANPGQNGRNNNCFGKNAEHLNIKVPLGTIIKDENYDFITDLSCHGNQFIAARGGAGGKGNKFFATSTDTAPTVYEEGGKGEERVLFTELKIIAQVGLIGFPNAGKSTLLRALSRARPKVAAYPFTTLKPQIGMIEYKDHEQVAVADIPGLIQGAHLNRGLGAAFLKHIERCACLLYVLDLSTPDPWEQFKVLQYELDQYNPGLSSRPHALVANKMDLPMSEKNLHKLQSQISDDMIIFPISAKEKWDIKPLVRHIRELYDKYQT